MAISRLKISLTDTVRNERQLNHIKFSVKTREARKKSRNKRNKDTEHGTENSYKYTRY